MLSRRGFFTGLAAALAAPAIITTPGLLMPIKPQILTGVLDPVTYTIVGRDEFGRIIRETVIGSLSDGVFSRFSYIAAIGMREDFVLPDADVGYPSYVPNLTDALTRCQTALYPLSPQLKLQTAWYPLSPQLKLGSDTEGTRDYCWGWKDDGKREV